MSSEAVVTNRFEPSVDDPPGREPDEPRARDDREGAQCVGIHTVVCEGECSELRIHQLSGCQQRHRGDGECEGNCGVDYRGGRFPPTGDVIAFDLTTQVALRASDVHKQGNPPTLEPERYTCVMNVNSYAQRRGVTPRRVRALIYSGAIPAKKVGRAWQIDSEVWQPRQRRPLSLASQEALGFALHNRNFKGLKGQERARTAQRMRMLRESEDPAQLLIDWWGGEKPRHLNAGTNLVLHAQKNHRDYVRKYLKARPSEYLRSRSDLAAVVSSERAIRGIAQEALAQLAEVSLPTLRSIERGRPVDSVSAVRKVLRAVDIEPTAIPAPGRR